MTQMFSKSNQDKALLGFSYCHKHIISEWNGTHGRASNSDFAVTINRDATAAGISTAYVSTSNFVS